MGPGESWRIKVLDADGSGCLNFKEFKAACRTCLIDIGCENTQEGMGLVIYSVYFDSKLKDGVVNLVSYNL